MTDYSAITITREDYERLLILEEMQREFYKLLNLPAYSTLEIGERYVNFKRLYEKTSRNLQMSHRKHEIYGR